MINKKHPVKKGIAGAGEGAAGRKQTGEAFALSEERYRNILENMQDSYIEVDLAGNFVHINEALCQNLGYTCDELIGKNFSVITPGDDEIREVFAAYNEVYKTGKPHKGFAFKVLRKDGTTGYGETSISLIKDARGRPVGFRSVGRDITERRQMEEALRKSEERFRHVLENVQDAVWSADLTGQYEYLSPLMARIYGRPLEEMVENPAFWIEAAHSEDQAAARASGEALVRDGHIECEYRIVLPDGNIRWILDRKTLIRDSQGESSRIAGIISDITDRKRNEKALRESEGKFSKLFKSNPTPMAISTVADGRYIDVNDSFLHLTGYTMEEVIGRSSTEMGIWAKPDSHTRMLEMMRGQGRIHNAEYEFCMKSGEARFGLLSVETISIGGQQCFLSILNDITDRKQAEEALRESESRYRLLSEHTIDTVWLMDMNLKITYQSPSVLKMRGFTAQEIMEMTTEQHVTPESFKLVSEVLLRELPRVAAEPDYNPVLTLELEYYCKDGTTIWTENKFSVIRDENHRPVSILGEARDITERKQVVEALKSKQIMLARTEGIAHVGSWEWDIATDIVTWSDELFRIFQRDPKQGAPSFAEQPAFYHPDDFALLRQAVEAAVADGTPYALELRAMRKDGETRVCMARGVAEMAPGGQVVRLFGSLQDITEHKKVEDALRESEDKYRNLVDLLHEGIWAIDENGHTTYVNNHMAQILGYTIEEMQGKELLYFMDDRGRESAARQLKRRREGISEIHDFEFLRKDGTRIYASISTAPIKDKYGNYKGAVAGIQDITDRKRLEEERQRVDKLEAVGLLAGGIAHDFNNILTAIMGNISLASMEAAPGSELHNSLQQAEKASLRAKDLTVQLLTFSRGGAPVKKLASLAELVKDTSRFALRGSNVKCKFSLPGDLWHAEIDAGQVSQVIHNLVINAQQAMPDGGSIEIGAENIALSEAKSIGKGPPLGAGNYVRITVADHGCGIPVEHLEKIFDAFFTTKEKGNGMGLATSFSIARQHEGHISVGSQAGLGSTFYLYLPASPETAVPRQDEKEAIKPVSTGRVLVMDDEQGIREVAGRMLRHIGYTDIEFASDGAEAIKLYKAAMETGKPFTAVILDLTIPGGMGGEVTVRLLRNIDPDVKAIVSSGYIDDPVIAKYKDYGFSGRMTKPYNIDEFGKALQDMEG